MMHSYLKDRSPWIQLLLFIGMAVGSFFVISLVAVLMISSITNLSLTSLSDSSSWDFTNPDMIVFIRGMLLAQFLGLFLIPCLLFGYFSHPRPLKYLGLKNPISPVYPLLAIVCLIVSIPLVEWLGLMNRNASFSPGMESWMKEMEESAEKQIMFMLSKNSVKDLALNIIFIAGFAAVGEELFFRGVLQKIFIRIFKNPWMGIVITATVFSAFHLQFYGFFPRLVLGILLGAAYWYSGSLWTSILAHFFYNGLIVVVAYFNPSLVTEEETSLFNPQNLIVPGILSLIAVSGIILYMHKRSNVTYADEYELDKQPPRADGFPF